MRATFRFAVGDSVMCNFGPDGWKLGRIIALEYREDHWPEDVVAPYQVLLEANHTLIYVPKDEAVYCREPTEEDMRISRRMDALAALPDTLNEALSSRDAMSTDPVSDHGLACPGGCDEPDTSYRFGRCHCCNECPRNWSYAELYSEHYRCAARNGLRVTHHAIDLGTIQVGDAMHHRVTEGIFTQQGYGQCPTVVRLPPGILLSDEGVLSGQVEFDPHRDHRYEVECVAVSTADWHNESIGLVRLEIRFAVEGNTPPVGFDAHAFKLGQDQARAEAEHILDTLYTIWRRWERRALDNRDTCDQMYAALHQLRDILTIHPRLDQGRWWAQLGGFHMNVHKLLENTLFECELYLGYALTFGHPEVRSLAEQNLKGCYQKRVLEAARFMWIEGIQQMMDGRWHDAIDTLERAAAQKDGWGWAVNYGDIWLSEAAARIVCGVDRSRPGVESAPDSLAWMARADELIQKAESRATEAGIFGQAGHPWITECRTAFRAYSELQGSGAEVTDWLENFKERTVYWCAQVLSGSAPFPPKPKPRLEDAKELLHRLRERPNQGA